MNKHFVVGLTGGIGSGKSAATARLSAHGIDIVDADVIARQVVERGSEALALIAEHFGKGVLQEDGALDRAALRAKIFSDNAARHWLEALLHPLIRERIVHDLRQTSSPYCVLSSPLLLEAGQSSLVDSILLIDASEASQIQRTSERDKLDPQAVEAIIATQWSREKRQRHADHILLNEGSLADLEKEIDALHEEFLQQAAMCRQLSLQPLENETKQ